MQKEKDFIRELAEYLSNDLSFECDQTSADDFEDAIEDFFKERPSTNMVIELEATADEFSTITTTNDETLLLETLGRVFEEGRYIYEETNSPFKATANRIYSRRGK